MENGSIMYCGDIFIEKSDYFKSFNMMRFIPKESILNDYNLFFY